MCTECENVKYGDTCFASCPEGTFADNGECTSCDAQCDGSCNGMESCDIVLLMLAKFTGFIDTGPTASDCHTCKYFSMNGQCVNECAEGMWVDPATPKICQYCHELCSGGCDGHGPDHCMR